MPDIDKRPWNLIVLTHNGAEVVRITRAPREVIETALIGVLLDAGEGVGGGYAQRGDWPKVCVWPDFQW